MAKFKLITLNVQEDHHTEMILPFLKKEDADIVCLQEFRAAQEQRFQKELQMYSTFQPVIYTREADHRIAEPSWGNAIFSKTPIKKAGYFQYSNPTKPTDTDLDTPKLYDEGFQMLRKLVFAEVTIQDTPIEVITTHFTWTFDGETSPLQITHLNTMLEFLKTKKEFILCGDFNAPRGKDIHTKLVSLYKASLPPEVTSTLDPKLHHAAPLEFVVDEVFSTPQFTLKTVKVVEGVSDHKAIVTEFEYTP